MVELKEHPDEVGLAFEQKLRCKSCSFSYLGQEFNSNSFCLLRLTTISMTGTSNKDKASTLLPPFCKKEPESDKTSLRDE